MLTLSLLRRFCLPPRAYWMLDAPEAGFTYLILVLSRSFRLLSFSFQGMCAACVIRALYIPRKQVNR